MGNLTLNGATSGQITLAPTAVAGTNTITLPAATGTVALTSGASAFTNLTVTNDATIHGLTVGQGGGSVSTNTALGNGALATNTTGITNVAVGYYALNSNSTNSGNVAVGRNALQFTIADNNTALGDLTLTSNTSGAQNVAVGKQALFSNTTASYNTAIGYQAGYYSSTNGQNTFIGNGSGANTTSGAYNVAIGANSLYAAAGSNNVAVGYQAGYNATSTYNTFVGPFSGFYITSGAKNTVIGNYNGNQGSLDIRTASNYIVLSDGDGNPRLIVDGNGNVGINTPSPSTYSGYLVSLNASAGYPAASFVQSTAAGGQNVWFYAGSTKVGTITTTSSATAYNTSSDYRLKENVKPMTTGLATVGALKPVTYDWIVDKSAGEGFIAHELQAIIPAAVSGEKDAVDEDGKIIPQGVDYSKLVVHLVAAIQELTAKVTALEAKVGA